MKTLAATRTNLSDPRDNADRERALARAIEEHGDRLLSIIGGRLRDRVEAEDVLQDVFEEFLEAYDVGLAIESLGGWLVRVATNKVVDRFRRRKTESSHREKTLEESDGPQVASDAPDEEWTRSLLRSEILDALEMLPPEQFEAFVRHELEGQSFEEISAATGVGINTLLSRKRAAVLFLREHLKEVYDELE